jgi:hypothetical protein
MDKLKCRLDEALTVIQEAKTIIERSVSFQNHDNISLNDQFYYENGKIKIVGQDSINPFCNHSDVQIPLFWSVNPISFEWTESACLFERPRSMADKINTMFQKHLEDILKTSKLISFDYNITVMPNSENNLIIFDYIAWARKEEKICI